MDGASRKAMKKTILPLKTRTQTPKLKKNKTILTPKAMMKALKSHEKK